MNPEYIPILTTLISVAGSFAVALLTWSVQMKKTRKEEHDEIMKALDEQKKATNKEIQDLKTDLFQVKSAVENKVSIIEIQIGELSNRVEKHNNVIERTYRLEQATAVQDEQIKNIERVINDLQDR